MIVRTDNRPSPLEVQALYSLAALARSAHVTRDLLRRVLRTNGVQFVRGGRALFVPLSEIKYYHFTHGSVDGVAGIISRTGYTGEDGFEIYAPPDRAEQLWNKILDAGDTGSPTGVLPCGLAARNTLRLEAGMALYGNDIDDTTTLLEANLGWICKLDKGDFTGRAALAQQKQEGLKRKLVGFEVTERGIARDHQDVVINGERVGQVTSGSPAPFLKKNIGLAYVPIEFATTGQEIQIDVRGKLVGAQIVKTPFYKRAK